jgi:hypothetical protein
MTATAVALIFVWLGMVLAISFIETPLKFRAPGMTIPLGLGIGRLVFTALNVVEIVLAVAIAILLLDDDTGSAQLWLLVVVIGCLVAQVAGVRPVLNRRTNRFLAGETPPGSKVHLVYIALEVVKIALLIALGTALS